MPARRLSDLSIVIVAGALILAIGAAGAILVPAPSPLDAGTSSYSAGPGGTKAAYLTLAALGYRVERSVEPITALGREPSHTLLIVSGHQPPSNQDRRALKRFVDAGGIVLGAGFAASQLLELPGPAVPPGVPQSLEDVEVCRALAASPLTAGASEITMPEGIGQARLPDDYVPLYGTGPGDVAVATRTSGKGRTIWWRASTPISNRHIAAADNLQLLLNTAGAPGDRTIVFDEHYEGHRRSVWSYAAGTPLPWIAAQTAVIGVAVFLTYSRRSGPMRARYVQLRTSPMEFVDMLGALYKRAGARPAAVAAARTRLRRTIAATCGVPAASDDDALARATAAVLGADASPLAALLDESRRASEEPDLPAGRALDVTRRLQALTARLLDARGHRHSSGGVN